MLPRQPCSVPGAYHVAEPAGHGDAVCALRSENRLIMTEVSSRRTQDATYAVSRLREANCRDEQYDAKHNTVQRTCEPFAVPIAALCHTSRWQLGQCPSSVSSVPLW